MSAEWYYIGHYGQLGPLTREQFDELIQGGVISRDTFVWKNGMTDWLHAEKVLELQPTFQLVDPFIAPPPTPAVPPAPRKPEAFPVVPSSRLVQPSAQSTIFVAGPVSDKNRVIAGILGILLPGAGRIYLGYSAIGALQLVFCIASFGVLSLWSIIDAIVILVGGVKTDGFGRTLPD